MLRAITVHSASFAGAAAFVAAGAGGGAEGGESSGGGAGRGAKTSETEAITENRACVARSAVMAPVLIVLKLHAAAAEHADATGASGELEASGVITLALDLLCVLLKHQRGSSPFRTRPVHFPNPTHPQLPLRFTINQI